MFFRLFPLRIPRALPLSLPSSVVRVLCFQQNYDKAAELCIETLDAPACYHLARQYEMQERVKEAIQFFQRARSYRNAVRLGTAAGCEIQSDHCAKK